MGCLPFFNPADRRYEGFRKLTRRKRRPLDQFHHQRDSARALFEAVNLRDVRMIESGWCASFAIKPRQPFGVLSDRLGKYFDRHSATEVGIRRPIHSPIPPTPIWAVIAYGPRRVPGVRAKLLEYKG